MCYATLSCVSAVILATKHRLRVMICMGMLRGGSVNTGKFISLHLLSKPFVWAIINIRELIALIGKIRFSDNVNRWPVDFSNICIGNQKMGIKWDSCVIIWFLRGFWYTEYTLVLFDLEAEKAERFINQWEWLFREAAARIAIKGSLFCVTHRGQSNN